MNVRVSWFPGRAGRLALKLKALSRDASAEWWWIVVPLMLLAGVVALLCLVEAR